MHASLLFLVSLVAAVSCHPLLVHIEKARGSVHAPALICPDQTSQCPNGDTCCELKDVKGYGCCPEPQAACCNDGIHCCPHGYKCSPGTNTCTKGDLTIAALKKRVSLSKQLEGVPAKRVKSPQNVICPDDTSECNTNTTCCKLASGVYGCCPQPNAVCCSDGKHCCPKGYNCDLSDGTCTKGNSVLTLLEKQPAVVADNHMISLIGRPRVVVCPDRESTCPDKYTCCPNKVGGYGCCSLPYAVCCADGKHCCPEDYACNLSNGTCTDASSGAVVRMYEKKRAEVLAVEPKNVICPDQREGCNDGTTCCAIISGGYGCCPIANATCCPDKKHCCPEHYKCGTNTCEKEDSKHTPEHSLKAKDPQLYKPCPGQTRYFCLTTQTCCKNETGGWSCCPYLNAACCDDGKTCCAEGSSCYKGHCKQSGFMVPSAKRSPAIDMQKEAVKSLMVVKSPQNVICPDNTSQCSSSETCCKLASGVYGCCPEVKAVCCSDGKHCCPDGYTCSLTTNTCAKGNSVLALLEKRPAIKTPQNVICPDGTSQCSTGQTCCKLASGEYGCCPQPNAVCCSDDKYCCPEGYTCSVGTGKCLKGDSVLTLLKKQPAIKTPQNVICPDGNSECGDKQTCCKLASGVYGCCPILNAVCCSDGKHCCPEGYDCSVGTGTCTKGDSVVAMYVKQPAIKKQPAITITSQNVICPDQQSECSDDSTCCQLASGEYGCCDGSNAVCCSDGKHCCPEGYSCDTTEGKCMQEYSLLTVLEKRKTIEAPLDTCPDGVTRCESYETCCPHYTGGYGCCPNIYAVCCSDGLHCCPFGTTCSWDSTKCLKRDSVLTLLSKQPAIKTPQNVVCPDGSSECGENQTCCKLASGVYGCCPQPNAVCCSDGKHCCPEGYDCSVGTGTCTKGDSVLTLLRKQPAIKTPQNVVCPDGQSQCASNTTCCKLASGVYGCCPKPNAVCCSDGKHCCPEGYDCDLSTNTCTKGDSVLALLKKQPAIKTPQNAICPDGGQCTSNQTCCPLSTGGYGCCNEPNAVCCSDEQHCCPEGYPVCCSDGQHCCPEGYAVCCSDGQHCCPEGSICLGDKCFKGDSVLTLLEKQPAIKTPQNVICPDETSECTSGQTCCMLASGVYGCCPEPNAVCCSDGEHCCPEGYMCSVGTGKCFKGDSVLALLKKQPAIKTPQNVVCPDGTSECGDKQTCCKLATGVYGCCPEPNAVCCSDGKHCCPEGYDCSVGTGTCTKRGVTLAAIEKKLMTVSSVDNVICPNESSQCPNGNTCCKKGVDLFNCCPSPDAVCCSDGEHCCPKGYVCNIPAQTCDDVSRGVSVRQLTGIFTRRAGGMERDQL